MRSRRSVALLLLQSRAHITGSRLPAATGFDVGMAPGADPLLSLLVVGESTVAGVGARHASGLTGQSCAGAGRAHRPRGALARAHGASGYRRAGARAARWLPAEPADAVVLALGMG
ncbi:MAG: hypothetical protein U0Z44_01145 [Kouleothrix sp.]